MARKAGKAATPPPPREAEIGDNSMTDSERREAAHRVIVREHRELDTKMDSIKATLKSLNKQRNNLRTRYKNETQISLENLDRVLEKTGQSRGDLVKDAVDWHQLCTWEGVPVGGQGDLLAPLEKTPQIARDALDWEAEGYRIGLRAGEPKPPKECPALHVTDFMKGYAQAQERNAWALAARGHLVDRDLEPSLKPSPVTEEVDPSLIDGEPRPAKAAGYETFQFQDDSWGVEDPDKEEILLQRVCETELQAWEEADRHLAAKTPAAVH